MTVSNLPPDWFAAEQIPILTGYCRHVCRSVCKTNSWRFCLLKGPLRIFYFCHMLRPLSAAKTEGSKTGVS